MYLSGLICLRHYSIIEMRKVNQFWPILIINILFMFYLVLKANNFLQH